MGSTAFIVFTLPNSKYSRTRNVIGGHALGLISGLLASAIMQFSVVPGFFVYALSIVLASLFMNITDTSHPPAAGTALGIAITGFSLGAGITVIVGAVTLSVFHRLLKPWLKEIIR